MRRRLKPDTALIIPSDAPELERRRGAGAFVSNYYTAELGSIVYSAAGIISGSDSTPERGVVALLGAGSLSGAGFVMGRRRKAEAEA